MEMTPKFIEIGSGKNLPPKIFEIVEVQKDNFMLKTEEPESADSLLVCGERKLMQYSVRQKKVIKNYGVIMASWIYSMVKTSDKKYLFVSDHRGY
jgi:hypothetical protein